MLNVIEPTNHDLNNTKIESLLRLFKIHQAFEITSKDQAKATFIIAEDEVRGVYGGAIFFPQKVRKLDENISNLLSIRENRTIWCARLCYYADPVDSFATIEAIEVCEDFYVNLYEILDSLGEKKETNCLPVTLRSEDYHNSLTYGHWAYFVHPNKSSSDYVYALLALPERKRKSKILRAKNDNGDENFERQPSGHTQDHTDRPAQ